MEFVSSFLSFVHMVKDDTRSYRLHTIEQKKHTHIYTFDFLRWGSILSIQQTYFVFYFDMCVFVWASCWWILYLWIVYVAKFKMCDKNLNAAWTATMRGDKKKTSKMKRKALNKINE